MDLTTYTPVCLPRAGADHAGETAWMVGWGVTSYGGTGSNKLLEVISCGGYLKTPDHSSAAGGSPGGERHPVQDRVR